MYIPKNIYLDENEFPRYYYNILPDLPEPLEPPLHPATREPIKPKDLEPIFPKELIRLEASQERYVKIPKDLRDMYIEIGRPRSLTRAYGLEKHLNLPESIRIYYKREDLSPTGSHKPNTAIAQAYYAASEGFDRLTTETGAGQWGSALSYSCQMFGLDCDVFMVSASYYQKPLRRILMNLFGARVYPSPSKETSIGRKLLKEDPDHPGSLGIAISEALELAISDDKTAYALGSVLNSVLTHQSIIGLETVKQLSAVGEVPTTIIGCVGGGSNFAGLAYPFLREKIKGKSDTRFIAVEPKACPTLTKGKFEYDYADIAGLTPLLKMYTLGREFVPPPIHAGGLRYHGDSPSLSLLVKLGYIDAIAYPQEDVFKAGRLFARSEGIVPAPETCHAVRAAIDTALDAKREKREEVILIGFSGHGLLDLTSYEQVPGF